MSDLLSSLASAARALDAQRYGLDIAGQNIANVNTPGYARRSIDLAEVPPLDATSAGGGVNVVAILAARAPLLAARLRHEQPAASRDAAVKDALATVQVGLGSAGSSIDAGLAAFFNAFGALSQDPTSGTARQQVVAQGVSLAQSFRTLAAGFDTSRAEADSGVRAAVDQVNALVANIAALNTTIGEAGAGGSNGALDQQGVAIESLSKLIDISVIQRTEGGVDISVGNGQALVAGGNAYQLAVGSTPPLGLAAVTSHGADITGAITGGRMGGLLEVRDVLVPAYMNQLDQLAYGVATDVNAAHAGGYDLNGNPGTGFFAPLAAVSGAAGAIGVNAALANNPGLVAAGATTAPGDNQVARQIAALQDVPVTGTTGKPVALWGDLVYRVGLDAQSAARDESIHQDVITQLQSLRDQVSGVSLDEEAAMMLRFQRAYEANARFFSAADRALDMLLQMIGA